MDSKRIAYSVGASAARGPPATSIPSAGTSPSGSRTCGEITDCSPRSWTASSLRASPGSGIGARLLAECRSQTCDGRVNRALGVGDPHHRARAQDLRMARLSRFAIFDLHVHGLGFARLGEQLLHRLPVVGIVDMA